MEAIIEILTDKFGFDLRMGLFSILNFFLVYLLLKKAVFDKLGKTMSDRQNLIDQGLSNYDKAQEELEKAKQEASKVIESAKEEAGKVIEASYKEAQVLADKIKGKTQEEVNLMLEKAQSNISQLEENMRVKLKVDTIDLIVKTLEKIFDNNVPDTVNKELIKKSINDLNK